MKSHRILRSNSIVMVNLDTTVAKGNTKPLYLLFLKFMVKFLTRSPSSPNTDASVKIVSSEAELNDHLQDVTFAFVLSIDPSMKDNSALHDYFIELADEHKMHGNFIIYMRPGDLRLQKLEVNRNPLTLQIPSTDLLLEKQQIGQFIEHHNHLLVTPLDKSNLRRLGRTGKPLIIAIVKDDHSASNNLLSNLEEVVADLDIEIAHRFVIGYMNGDKYATYLERYRGALSPPSLLVLDLSVNGYYVTKTLTKEKIKETVDQAITKTLSYVEVDPVDLSFFKKIQWKLKQYYPWSLLCCLPLVFFCLSFLFPHPNSVKEKLS